MENNQINSDVVVANTIYNTLMTSLRACVKVNKQDAFIEIIKSFDKFLGPYFKSKRESWSSKCYMILDTISENSNEVQISKDEWIAGMLFLKEMIDVAINEVRGEDNETNSNRTQ